MRTAAGPSGIPTALLGLIRDARFSRGIRCPRCGADRVQRWGSFSGRQRYRCRECRRTFSDLTGTPAAYAKKLPLWVAYGRCLAESLTIRRAAARLDIHPCTSFRWRHALLDGLRANDVDVLEGWIELAWQWFDHSQKGRRNIGEEVRRRGERSIRRQDRTGVNALIACDRRGIVISAMTDLSSTRRVSCGQLDAALDRRIAGAPIITAAEGQLGACGTFARRRGGTFHDARPGIVPRTSSTANTRSGPAKLLTHVRTVRRYRDRLVEWLRRFRGVATRYLLNYLVWHRGVDRALRSAVGATALRWPVGDAIRS
jgi:transposase-like protein